MSKFAGRSFVREVVLPSRGVRYEGKLPGGRVQVAAISLTEQLAIASSGESGEKVVELLLSTLVDFGESGLTPADLLSGDRMFLLYQIRALSYGPIKWSERCYTPNCGVQVEFAVALDQLPVISLKDDEIEPFFVDLPARGVRVGLRSLRKRDEDAIAAFVSKTQMGANGSMLPRMASRIVSVQGETLDLSRAMVWLTQPALEGPDLMALEQAIENGEPGPYPLVSTTCPSCRAQHETEVPLDATFFRPVARRRPGS